MTTPAIWHPDPAVSREGFVSVLFRRRFQVTRPVRAVTLWVSASQRFELYLDGRRVARGPSRSGPWRWGVVPVRLTGLAAGAHVVAARVTHFGPHGGVGQLGGPAFFLLCADREEVALRTDDRWRCWHDRSREGGKEAVWGSRRFTYDIGAGEVVWGEHAPWGWESSRYRDGAWPMAREVCKRAADSWGNMLLGHVLRRDPLPPMEERAQRFQCVAEVATGLQAQAVRWIRGAGRLVVPARSTVRLVLDMGELTNAYPVLTVSGGRGALIRWVSVEAPFEGDNFLKGNRDVTRGKHLWGQCDEFHPDGGRRCVFSTLWFRPFRYVELTVSTKAEPAALEDVELLFTGFPLKQAARFSAYERMWEMSWRTVRLCSHETFFDCPHYEQLQFPGDTRVQAIFHYAVADEDRLARKAIDDFHGSRSPLGLTLCKYPSRSMQTLPTYALYWIGMMHDFRVYRGDADFLRPYMDGAREAMGWFERRVRRDGMLGLIEYAPFCDWAEAFPFGNAPQDEDGGSAILTLLFAEACHWMNGLEAFCGHAELAPKWHDMGARLVAAALKRCWDGRRGLVADTAHRGSFSVHAQVQAVLAGAWPVAKMRRVLLRAWEDAAVTQPGTFYYRHYVMQALKMAGARDRFGEWLAPWRKCMDGTGLTTWPESFRDGSRSDCHAWSVSPAIEFLQTVLGVEPDPQADGFARGLFQPSLGDLTGVEGQVPTPHGTIHVRLKRTDRRRVEAEVATPIPLWVGDTGAWVHRGEHRLTVTG